MNEELTLAIDLLREMSNDRTWFIPVLLNACQVPERRISRVEELSDLQAVDLSKDWSDGIEKVLAAMGLGNPSVGLALQLASVASHVGARESLEAIERLGDLAVADRRVLSVLLDALARADRYGKTAALRALVKIGADAVPALAEALPAANDDTQKYILQALIELGPAAREAVGAIVRAGEQHASERINPGIWFGAARERAIGALAAIGPDAHAALPYLAPLLHSRSARIRALAAFALTRIGSASALAEALSKKAWRREAAEGILWAAITGRCADARRALDAVGLATAMPGLLAAFGGDSNIPKDVLKGVLAHLDELGFITIEALPLLKVLRQKSYFTEDKDRLDLIIARLSSTAPPATGP